MGASLILGALVGVIMGLTGAGGGILAVPLLVFGLHLTVASAAPLGLLAVGIAAAMGAAVGLRAIGVDAQVRGVAERALHREQAVCARAEHHMVDARCPADPRFEHQRRRGVAALDVTAERVRGQLLDASYAGGRRLV